MKKKNIDLISGIRSVKEYSPEETLLFAKIFIDNEKSPDRITMEKIIEEKIKGYYYQLAHIPDSQRTAIKDAFISGIIQALEQVLMIREEFIICKERIEKEAKK